MSAFVAGATGYTGRAVVRVLRQKGHAVFAHVRPDSSELDRWQKEFAGLGATVDVTPWQAQAMTARLRQLAPSQVFALLGTTRKRSKAEGHASAELAYEKIDFGLTVLLLEAVRAAGIPTRFVYLSSLGVSPNTTNPYLRARARVEATLAQSAVPHTVVRPSFITGPDRGESRPGERLAAAVADGLLHLAPRRWRDRFQSIDSQSLARVLVELSLDTSTENRVIEAEEIQEQARATAS